MRFGELVGKRVSLRAVRDQDLAGIEGWYDEAAQTAFEERSLSELSTDSAGDEPGLLAIARPDADEPIGLIAYAVKDRWAAIPFIALAKAYRGWGYGSEAVRLLEQWAVREGIGERFRAEVDARNGLGLYFWLRLGYRPEGVAINDQRRDWLAMVREEA